jgi:aspartate beta-hydroxylase
MGFLYDRSADIVRQIYDHRIVGPATLDLDTHFPDAPRFTDNWLGIRKEALAIAEHLERVPRFHDFMPEQAEISANDQRDWRLYILKAYGTDVPRNMATCPLLTAVAQSIPDVLSVSLSFLAPGKHIPQHRGPFRGVLRFYLGLSVPRDEDDRPAVVLTIDGIEHRIGDGECLLWDDTYPHEVRNRSDQIRAALLLDVKRPGMPLDMKIFSRMLIAAAGIGIRLRGVGAAVA